MNSVQRSALYSISYRVSVCTMASQGKEYKTLSRHPFFF
jgi:hypothetical protein